ncbi:MAG: lytic transglycosylase domain-containing protein [Bacteriovoracaceae bacterium]|nr:lytic transglycosylase domain-containing protein [Bacteriovoracaceae bacterium]
MKYCYLLIILTCINAWSFTNPNAFLSELIEVEETILDNSIKAKSKGAHSAIKKDLLKVILEDKKGLIDDEFDIPEYFKPSTYFWFSVYTQYSSKQVVIHDKENLGLVYNVMDFEPLYASNINRFAKSKLQADLSLERTKKIKSILSRLHLAPSKLNPDEKAVLNSIKSAGIKIPKYKRSKKKLFLRLSTQIRTQTGQRDMVYNGVLRSLPYLPFLHKQFKNFKIPKELLAIAFVESSFNLKARSYAGAAGIWQFMPRTSASFMPRRSRYIDYRSNPIISSIAAFHLLKQNKQILKRWDLAVPAYNFGTSHLVRARRKYKKKATLPYILENYKHSSVGFASKNYYSEFLAMVYALAYKDLIFPLSGYAKKDMDFKQDDIGIYVTKCKVRPKTFYKLLKKNSPNIKRLNSHFIKNNVTYKRNKIVISDLKLSSKRYRKITDKEILKYFPKNYYKVARKLKCGR